MELHNNTYENLIELFESVHSNNITSYQDFDWDKMACIEYKDLPTNLSWTNDLSVYNKMYKNGVHNENICRVIATCIAFAENNFDAAALIYGTNLVHNFLPHLNYQVPTDCINSMIERMGIHCTAQFLIRTNNLEGINWLCQNDPIYLDHIHELYKQLVKHDKIDLVENILKMNIDKIKNTSVIYKSMDMFKLLISYGVDSHILFKSALAFENDEIMRWYIDTDTINNIDPVKMIDFLQSYGINNGLNKKNIELLIENINLGCYLNDNLQFFSRILSISLKNEWIDIADKMVDYVYIDADKALSMCLMNLPTLSVKWLLDMGGNVNTIIHGLDLLSIAIINRNHSMIKLLIKYNINIDSGKCYIYDALVSNLETKTIKLLIKVGANINIDSEQSMLRIIRNKNMDVLNMLIDNNIPIDTNSTQYIKTCIEYNNIPAIDKLVEYNINIKVDIDDMLIESIFNCNHESALNMLNTLIKYNIELPITNQNFINKVSDYDDIVKLLESNGYRLMI